MGAGHRDSSNEHATSVDVVRVEDLQDRIQILTAFTRGIVFELDREGRYVRIFTGEPLLLVRPAECLIGRLISEIADPSKAARFHDAIREVFDTGDERAFEYELDVPAGRRMFSCIMMAHDGPTERTVTVHVRDVTSAKAVEAKLMQSERLASVGLLAASVGHEIRQPLSYVMTSLDALERELASCQLPDHTHESFEKIRAATGRIAEIAASLDLLAADRRRKTTAIDVRRPLGAARDQCATELAALSVEVNVPELPLVRADEGELCQVFANILMNAAQALEELGDKQRVVRVRAAVVADLVRISICDNGFGIAHEHLAHIFDPFFTTRAQRGGTGLGLFIARGIVEAHGGTLEVKSECGRGTTVEVLLPVAQPSSGLSEPLTGVRPRPLAPAARSAPLAAPSKRRHGGDGAQRRRLSLLLVDDEPRFLDSLRLALDDVHAVETRQKARDALALIEAEPKRYDVVLCDLAMPELDGMAFYVQMKALGVENRFVLMTGGAFTATAAAFLKSGECPSINKPFLIDELLTLLDDVTQSQSAS